MSLITTIKFYIAVVKSYSSGVENTVTKEILQKDHGYFGYYVYATYIVVAAIRVQEKYIGFLLFDRKTRE